MQEGKRISNGEFYGESMESQSREKAVSALFFYPMQTKKSATSFCKLLIFRAENGTRTRDLNLGKVALYQLSYFRIEQRRLSFASAKVGKKNALPNFWPLFFDFFVLLFPEEQGGELYVVDNKARFKILLRGARKFRCEPLSLPS